MRAGVGALNAAGGRQWDGDCTDLEGQAGCDQW